MSKNTGHDYSTKLFDNKILRVPQVAEMLQFSKWHVYRLVSEDQTFPYHKKGKTLFFKSEEIFEWIEGRKKKRAS